MYAKLSIKAPSQPASIPTTKNKDAQYRDMPALDNERSFSSLCRRNETHMCPCPFPSLCGISPRYFAHATVAPLSMNGRFYALAVIMRRGGDLQMQETISQDCLGRRGTAWYRVWFVFPPAAGPCRPFHVVSHLAYCVSGAIPTE